MSDNAKLEILKSIEDVLSEGKTVYDYRECLITFLSAKKFTVRDAKKSIKKNSLFSGIFEMNSSIALKYGLNFFDILIFNDHNNAKYIIDNFESDEPLTLINQEVKNIIISSKNLLSEIKKLLQINKTKEEDESILVLFDEDTQTKVSELLKLSFDCYKFPFAVVLNFTRKDKSEFNFQVELVTNNFESNTGLSRRPYLPDGAGMWYQYESEGSYGFITENVVRDLSVAYINREGIIVDIIERKANDCEPYYNTIPAKCILEVTKGWFEEKNIHVGDSIKIKTIVAER